MSTHTLILGRAGYGRLRQGTGLADVLLDQLEAVLRLDDVGRMDYDALHAAALLTAHAGEVLRLDAARESAEQLAKLGGTQPCIEGVNAALAH